MDQEKISRLEQRIADLRGSGRKFDELASLAIALGRQRRKKRGGHPIFVSQHFKLRPLSIPYSSKGVKRFTAEEILTDLEDDLWKWKEWLEEQQRKRQGSKPKKK